MTEHIRGVENRDVNKEDKSDVEERQRVLT
jgi:hypothetical protein